jgi:hypothetical protein
MPKPVGAVSIHFHALLRSNAPLTQQTVGQDRPYHGAGDNNSRLFDLFAHLFRVSLND